MKSIYEKLARCSSLGEVKRILAGNGVVIVPREPTLKMKMRAEILIADKGSNSIFTSVSAIYQAMIAGSLE